MDRYNWSAVPVEQMNPKTTRQVIHTETMSISQIGVQQGYVVPVHLFDRNCTPVVTVHSRPVSYGFV